MVVGIGYRGVRGVGERSGLQMDGLAKVEISRTAIERGRVGPPEGRPGGTSLNVHSTCLYLYLKQFQTIVCSVIQCVLVCW
jgi:hypothetical protein